MTTIKFGWHMPSFPTDGSTGPAFRDQIIDTLGHIQNSFDSAWADDHLHPWAEWQPSDTVAVECLTTLTYLSALFPTLNFGSLVVCQSFRNPALLAKTVANMQLMSGGRIILGLGAGWMVEEYQAYNYDYPGARVRLAQLEETVQIIRLMWREAPASFKGQYYAIDQAYCEPKPDPIPPIMIGGGGENVTLRIVAQYADWWNMPGGTPEAYAHKLAVLRDHCKAVGRDFDEITKTASLELVSVAETEQRARQMAHASAYYSEEAIIGTPDQVTDQLRAYTALGIEHFMLRFADFPATHGIDLFAAEVVPQFE